MAPVLLTGLGALLCFEHAVATVPRIEIVPGSVIRWTGNDTVLCATNNEVWAPIGEICYFPIDLMAEGELALERVRVGREERVIARIGEYPYPTQHLTVEPGMVHLTPENEARHERERDRIIALWSLRGSPQFMLPLHSPLRTEARGKNFGARRLFNNEPRNPHTGIDYSAKKGTAVLAAANGTVVLAEEHYFAGKSLFIDHGDGLITMYFHLDRILVHNGESVERGQRIATVGSSGRATGPHLHFGVRWRGARVDPRLLLGSIGELPAVPESY
jgi:murein DD-endopeptidase MepM/ murein hydrolase activator NlpD